MRELVITAAAVSTALVTVATGAPADGVRTRAPAPIFKTVATDLHNPRQLDFSRAGAMYVAEAGRGGRGPCMVGGEGSTVCFGRTGSVMRVAHGKQHRVLTRLASLGDQGTGQSALGPAGIAFVGKHTVVLSFGFGTNPAKRKHLPKAGQNQLAHLIAFNLRSGKRTVVGDLGAYEHRANPVDSRDTDPTGVVPAGRRGYLVTDSGGNTLVAAHHGHVRGLAAFGDRRGTSPVTGPDPVTYQAVPTDVVKGPDGAFYVSELTGFPFIRGAARIWRVVPGHKPHVWATGLTDVTSLAFSGRKLYAVQIADRGLADAAGPIGSLRRVFPKSSGKRSRAVASNLFAPYGVAIRHRVAYVSIGAVLPAHGSVIKVPLR